MATDEADDSRVGESPPASKELAAVARAARLPQLDLLRALAVLLVLGRHSVGRGWVTSPVWPLPAAFQLWRRAGWAGVDLFFVLSGFLVAGLLFQEHRNRGSLRIGRFLVRRGFKIYPAFYSFIAISFVARVGLNDAPPLEALFAECVFLQNYLEGMWVHTWSLAVEEHFYLLLSLLLVALASARRGGVLSGGVPSFRPVVAVWAVVALVALALRIGTALFASVPVGIDSLELNMRYVFPTHLRIDSLFCGVALAYFHHYHPKMLQTLVEGHRRTLLLLSVALISPIMFLELHESRFLHSFGFLFLQLGFAGIVMLAVWTRVPSHALARAPVTLLAGIGYYSYSIYLWHVPVRDLLLRGLFRELFDVLPFLVRKGLYVTVCVVIGIVMAKLIEVPFLRLRDRWFPSRTR